MHRGSFCTGSDYAFIDFDSNDGINTMKAKARWNYRTSFSHYASNQSLAQPVTKSTGDGTGKSTDSSKTRASSSMTAPAAIP